jgi:acyl dehydratase
VRAGLRPAVGDRSSVVTFGPLTRTDFVRYQGASGEFHPLHHDEPYANSCGFPSVFSLGMLHGGLLAGVLVDWFGAESVRRYSMRFLDQCWPGDVLTCSGTVTAVWPGTSAGDFFADVALTCVRQTQAVAVAATACVAIAGPSGG